MQIMNDINWRLIAQGVQSSLNENEFRFRRIWINYTRLGSVQFTLFPPGISDSYRIVTLSKVMDCNKNVFAYARNFVPELSFATPPTDEDRAKAIEVLTEHLTNFFVGKINADLTPAP